MLLNQSPKNYSDRPVSLRSLSVLKPQKTVADEILTVFRVAGSQVVTVLPLIVSKKRESERETRDTPKGLHVRVIWRFDLKFKRRQMNLCLRRGEKKTPKNKIVPGLDTVLLLLQRAGKHADRFFCGEV